VRRAAAIAAWRVLSCVVMAAAVPSAAPPVAASDDPGFELELDLARNELRTRDVRSGEAGPVLRVAVGSPGHPTPRGRFRLGRVILKPSWRPGAFALDAGARPERASLGSPMGVAKIPFAENGSIALHGGGDPDVLGKPVSSGCVRASDADLLRLIAWFDLHGGLAPARVGASGEVVRDLWRAARLHVH
jgi:hypothetical protein